MLQERLENLSRPRTVIEENSVNKCGLLPSNQELIRPIPGAALSYVPSKRICQLAAPRKRNISLPPPEFGWWETRDVPKRSVCFERLEELAQPPSRHYTTPSQTIDTDLLGRVNPSALKYEITERVNRLAQPRRMVKPKKEAWINEASLRRSRKQRKRYNPAHDELLAQPRTYQPPFDYEDWSRKRIQAAARYETQARDIVLSMPRLRSDDFVMITYPEDIFLPAALASEYEEAKKELKKEDSVRRNMVAMAQGRKSRN